MLSATPRPRDLMPREFPLTDADSVRDALSQRWNRPVQLRDLGGYLGRNQIFEVRDRLGIVKLFHNEADVRSRREIEAYHILNGLGLPLPELRDSGRLPDGTPWIYLSHMPGVLLENVDSSWGATARTQVYRETGALIAAMHDAPVSAAVALQGKNARQRFRENADHVLQRDFADHARFVTAAAEIAELEAALPERNACLVHRDACARNILVEKRGNSWTLSSLIDFELALMGDPMEDLAKIAFKEFERIPESRAAVLSSYAARRPFSDDDGMRFRLHLLYLAFEIANWAMADDPPFHQQAAAMLRQALNGDPRYTLNVV